MNFHINLFNNKRSVLFITLLVLGISCNDSGTPSKALVNVLLVDAPGDFDEVWIEILGVEILPSGSRGEDNSNWVFLPYVPSNKKINVSNLVAENSLLLGRKEIRAGNITKIKLVLGNDHHLVKGDQQIPLTVAPNHEEMATLDVNFPIDPGFAFDIYIDFNIATSIVKEQAESFVLKPAIRSFTTIGTASIQGTILPHSAKPFLLAINETDTFSTLTNNSGNFIFRGLPQGEYQLYINPISTYLDSLVQVTAKADSVFQLPTVNLQPVEGDQTIPIE